jgi:hypothetical protein
MHFVNGNKSSGWIYCKGKPPGVEPGMISEVRTSELTFSQKLDNLIP